MIALGTQSTTDMLRDKGVSLCCAGALSPEHKYLSWPVQLESLKVIGSYLGLVRGVLKGFAKAKGVAGATLAVAEKGCYCLVI